MQHLDSSDVVEQVEGAVRRALRGAGESSAAERARAVRQAVEQVSTLLSNEDRQLIWERLQRRNPQWLGAASNREDVPTDTEATSSNDKATTRSKSASMERNLKEVQHRLAEVEEELKHKTEAAAEVQRELEQRMDAHRKLQKRAEQDREELLRLTEQVSQDAATLHALRTRVSQAEREQTDQAERLIRLDTELKSARQLLRSAGADLSALEAPPPKPTESPKKAEVEAPAPPAPPIVSSQTYEAFCARLCEEGKLRPQEIPPASEERDRRLGVMAAALVLFLEKIESTLFAQLDELKRRHTFLSEHGDVLRYLRKDDRPWWWALTERTGRQVVPERHFGNYLSQISKMNFAMLTAYYKALTGTVSVSAREMMSPMTLRKQSTATRGDALWAWYESHASSAIPRALADACQAEFAKVVDSLYRFGSENQ